MISLSVAEPEEREKKTYFISNRHLPASISFELTNWVNLSIIFDLFGVAVVCTNDGGLPQTMFVVES